MADMLKSGVDWLHRQRHGHAASLVTYQRGTKGVNLQATRGETRFAADSGDAGVIEYVSRDFLFRPADLDFGSGPVRPQAGDLIVEPVGEGTMVHQVLAPAGEPVWRWSDPYRTAIRVHTKEVAET